MRYLSLLIFILFMSCALFETNDVIDDPINGRWVGLVYEYNILSSGYKTNYNDILILQRRKRGLDYTKIYNTGFISVKLETNSYYYSYKETIYTNGININVFEREIEIIKDIFTIKETVKIILYNDKLYIDVDRDKALIIWALLIDMFDGYDIYVRE